MLSFFAGGGERLQAANPAQNIDFIADTQTHPLHSLHQDPALEKKISDVCKRVFDKPLVLNRHAGNMIYLHVGDAPESIHGTDPPSLSYRQALNNLPRLEQQGDGMKSFIGLMLNILTSAYPFVFVDEPEAFLHPPQARLLGRVLGEEKKDNSQIFLATHDSDFLTGLLDSPAEDVTVVRLVREENINHASQLDSQSVKELWKDPLLRYSNILDGLFHEAVILCEGDADCRYYSSVLDSVEETEEDFKSPDLLFTHCGGKSRIPMVVKSLKAVSVPVKVVADFDVLTEKNLLKKIVETLGGDWSEVESDWGILKSTLDSISDSPSTTVVQEKVNGLLDKVKTPKLQKTDAIAIRNVLKISSGWDRTKKSGKAALPAGPTTVSFERLCESLRKMGLFVVEVGELENWVPQVDSHRPSWIAKVHEQGLHKEPSITAPRNFVRSLVGSVR